MVATQYNFSLLEVLAHHFLTLLPTASWLVPVLKKTDCNIPVFFSLQFALLNMKHLW
jgi:hypothetical protein